MNEPKNQIQNQWNETMKAYDKSWRYVMWPAAQLSHGHAHTTRIILCTPHNEWWQSSFHLPSDRNGIILSSKRNSFVYSYLFSQQKLGSNLIIEFKRSWLILINEHSQLCTSALGDIFSSIASNLSIINRRRKQTKNMRRVGKNHKMDKCIEPETNKHLFSLIFHSDRLREKKSVGQ